MPVQETPHYSLSLVTAPTGKPLLCDELKAYISVCHTEDDDILDSLIDAATEYLQDALGRQFIQATYDLFLDEFPTDHIQIKRLPVSSITSITYVDGNGDSQTWASSKYQTDFVSEPARVKPVFGENWPATRDQFNAVTVRFVAGEGTIATAIPAKIKQTIAVFVNHWYQNPDLIGTGKELPLHARSLVESLMWEER